MLSRPGAELGLREPKVLSHHSGVVGDRDRVVEGE